MVSGGHLSEYRVSGCSDWAAQRAHQPNPALGRWAQESTNMKKLIAKAALLLATTLAIARSAVDV